MRASPHRDDLYGPVDGPGRSEASDRAAAADPRWIRLGIAAALGLVAGALLFPTEAKGRADGRRPGPKR